MQSYFCNEHAVISGPRIFPSSNQTSLTCASGNKSVVSTLDSVAFSFCTSTSSPCTWFCRGRKETTKKCTIRGFDTSTVQCLAASDSKSLRRRCLAARARQNAVAAIFNYANFPNRLLHRFPPVLDLNVALSTLQLFSRVDGRVCVSSREPLRYQDGLLHICACQLTDKVGLSVLAWKMRMAPNPDPWLVSGVMWSSMSCKGLPRVAYSACSNAAKNSLRANDSLRHW